MWFHIKRGALWEVGFFSPDSTWYAVKQFSEESEAARYVNYLNGGHGRYLSFRKD